MAYHRRRDFSTGGGKKAGGKRAANRHGLAAPKIIDNGPLHKYTASHCGPSPCPHLTVVPPAENVSMKPCLARGLGRHTGAQRRGGAVSRHGATLGETWYLAALSGDEARALRRCRSSWPAPGKCTLLPTRLNRPRSPKCLAKQPGWYERQRRSNIALVAGGGGFTAILEPVRSRGNSIEGGTSEILRNIIAERRAGPAARAPRRQGHPLEGPAAVSESEGRGAAWTEERSDEGPEGGALKAPRRRAEDKQ